MSELIPLGTRVPDLLHDVDNKVVMIGSSVQKMIKRSVPKVDLSVSKQSAGRITVVYIDSFCLCLKIVE